MPLDPRIAAVTARIVARSATTRSAYLARMAAARDAGVARAHLSCSNAAHAYAASGADKPALAAEIAPNLGIITAYNDMLSAHRPYEHYPEAIRAAARRHGATAQVAGGVPAMCDGVTQGTGGMELSLFSRDVIALSAGVALSHNCYDAVLWLGVCDKIVPGLVMAAGTFGYLPSVFVPAGPMTSGMPNEEKAKVRQAFAAGEITRAELMAAEMAAYHGPGTCTFYGTANTNQMLMEIMGLQLPGSAFINPGQDLRARLTEAAVGRAVAIAGTSPTPMPLCEILDERAFVNGIVGLMATGGSTNLILHLPAMARCCGIILDLEDFAEISQAVPLLARVYPNGLADVNHFHAAGGIAVLIGTLLDAGLLHEDVQTILGQGLSRYRSEPVFAGDALHWREVPAQSVNSQILRGVEDPFSPTGGLQQLRGNLGDGVIKVSAVPESHHIIRAPARVFESQEAVKAAFKANELTADVVVVVRHQGPKANGMPELHALTPLLSLAQARGQRVALVTDGRMSGASGKIPAALHLTPEAADGGPLAKIQDGDMIELNAITGQLNVLTEGFEARETPAPSAEAITYGLGRELFSRLRHGASSAREGASIIL